MDKESRLLFFLSSTILLFTVFVNFFFQQEYAVELHYDATQPSASQQQVLPVSTFSASSNSVQSLASNEDESYELPASSQEDEEEAPKLLVVQFPLNINHCTKEELLLVPGVGEVLAQRILQYRDVLEGYTDLTQLMEIKGIGEGTYAEIEPYLIVDAF